jgi:hypothetical protein
MVIFTVMFRSVHLRCKSKNKCDIFCTNIYVQIIQIKADRCVCIYKTIVAHFNMLTWNPITLRIKNLAHVFLCVLV